MSKYKAKALEIHPSKANCAQALVVAYGAAFGLDEETAYNVSLGLGRGVSGLNEICGTVTGVSLVLGLAFKDRAKVFALTKQYADLFTERNGSIVCGRLLGLVPPAPGDKPLSKRPCHDYVADACDFLDSVLPLPPDTL